MKRQDSLLALEASSLSTLLYSLPTAAGRRTETIRPRATKGREKRLSCPVLGNLE